MSNPLAVKGDVLVPHPLLVHSRGSSAGPACFTRPPARRCAVRGRRPARAMTSVPRPLPGPTRRSASRVSRSCPAGPATASFALCPTFSRSGHPQKDRRTYMRALLARLAAILAAVGLLLTSQTLTTAQQAAAADPGYLMVHFTGEGSTNQQMYLSHSTDGLHWNDLNGGGMVLRSTVGTKGVRDPAFVRSPAGSKYWIIATDLCIGCGQGWGDAQTSGSRNLVVWESTDLVTWSQPRVLNVADAIPGAGDAWAPEAIWK